MSHYLPCAEPPNQEVSTAHALGPGKERGQGGIMEVTDLKDQTNISSTNSGGPSFMTGASHFTVGQMNIKTATHNYMSASAPAFESDGQCLNDVSQWLTPTSFINVFKTALEQRMEGTGEWFLKRPEFSQLLEGSSIVLWATGQPGSGKTVISALSVDALQRRASECRHGKSDIAVLYAFIRYSEKLSANNILASLLSQLLMASGKLSTSLRSKYTSCKQTGETLTTRELAFHLREGVELCEKVVIALDGLDEASTDVQETLLEVLPPLGANLLITSRPLPLLDCYIASAFRVYIQALTADVDLFVRGRIAKSSRLRVLVRGNPGLVDEICARVQKQSDGMFLLARLQMEVLETQPNTLKGLKSALADLPRGLDAMYDQTLERITEAPDGGALGMRVLMWLAHVQERISIEDLQCALSTSHEDLTYDADDLAPLEIMIGACCGLVEVRKNVDFWSDGWHRYIDEVRFVHYTTLELLLRRSEILAVENPHALMSDTCLVHVQRNMGVLPGLARCYNMGPGIGSELLRIPMLVYSYQNWATHARLSYTKLSRDGSLPPSILTFIREVKNFPIHSHSFGTPPLGNGLHLCARYSFVDTIRDGKLPLKTEPTGNFTPFHVAAFFGRVDSLYALLDAGYSGLHSADSSGSTPLDIAVRWYQPDIVEALLFPSSPSGSSRATISDLASRRLKEIQVNSRDFEGLTPLHRAVLVTDHDSLALLLRRTDIDVNSQNRYGHTALMIAAMTTRAFGNQALWETLLSHRDIEYNAQDNGGITALIWAYIANDDERCARCAWQPSVRVRGKLTKFDLHLRDNEGLSALDHACLCCNALDVQRYTKEPGKYSSAVARSNKLSLKNELYPINFILEDGAGEWSAKEICNAAGYVMANKELFRPYRVAPRVALLLLRMMQTCTGVAGDWLGNLLFQASSMPCTSCLAAVLSALGGPRISFLDECECAHCSSWDLGVGVDGGHSERTGSQAHTEEADGTVIG